MKSDVVFRISILLFLVVDLTVSSREEPQHPSCKERRSLMGLEKDADDYILVEAYIGQEIQLECHYCNEDDTIRKLWYVQDRFFQSPPTEVEQDFSHVDVNERKLVVNEHHVLIIRNFNEHDGGIYFCQGYEDTASKFNYIVDVIGEEEPFISIKTTKDVTQFTKDKINPLNKLLSKEDPFKIGNAKDEVHFKIHLEWSSWGPCKVCNRVAGIKKRGAKCELRPSKEKFHKKSADKSRSGVFQKMKFGIGFSCHSLLLEKLVSSKLAKEIRELPVIVETDNCAGECKSNLIIPKQTIGELAKEISESEAEDANFPPPPQLDSKSEERVITNVEIVGVTIKEFGKPFYLHCPLETEEEIIWAKGDKMIKKGKRMEVDILDRLLLKKLDFQDLGEYSCTVDQTNFTIVSLELLEVHLRFSHSQLIYIWSLFIIFVLLIWFCCVTVIYLNHKKVSREFLRRISLEDDFNNEIGYTLLKEV